jgi:hypothetical protein
MVALNLFSNQKGFEEFDNVVKLRESRKRGKYNKKVTTNNQYQFLLILAQLINPYSYISTIYNHIANTYLTMPLLSNDEAAFYYQGLNVWYSVYEPVTYTYYDYPTQGFEGKGDICPGEDFKIFEAELIGTENFSVTDRIDLHIRLLDLLEQGVQLKQAVELMQPEIERIKRIYDKEKADTLARDKSGIFKRV